MNSVPDPQVWATRGIVGLKHVVSDGRLHSFPDLKAEYALPQWMLCVSLPNVSLTVLMFITIES